MANQYIVNIGMNDTLPDVIRKSNHNFRLINANQTKQTMLSIRDNNTNQDAAWAEAIANLQHDFDEDIATERQARIDADQAIMDSIADMLLTMYPIGSLYLSVVNTDPSTFIGGTWQRIKDAYLVGAGSTYVGSGGDSIEPGSSNIPWIAVYIWQRVS